MFQPVFYCTFYFENLLIKQSDKKIMIPGVHILPAIRVLSLEHKQLLIVYESPDSDLKYLKLHLIQFDTASQ